MRTNKQLILLHKLRNGCFEAMRSFDTPQHVKEAFLRAAERYTVTINQLQNIKTKQHEAI